jgi:hypothetical protein
MASPINKEKDFMQAPERKRKKDNAPKFSEMW